MAIGPLGRAGVLMMGITGTDSLVPIMGVMPGMGLMVVIGIGVRMGTLGIMGTFGIVPIPAKAQGQIQTDLQYLDNMTSRLLERFSNHFFL